MTNAPTTNTRRRPRLGWLAALALVALLPGVASAQATAWPSRPVTLVVGTPAGGSIDVYARSLADQLTRQTGGHFIVENKAGVNGNISAESVLRAPADGHTLWISTQAMYTINPSVYPALKWKPADFTPIAKGVENPLVLVVHPSLPVEQFSELARWAQAQPAQAAFASFSPGTPSHFLGVQLNERLKTAMVHVPYKGSGPQITDLLGGQVPLGFTQLQAALPHVQSGRLRALAVTSPTRSRFLPQVPTLAELGQPDLSATVWFGVLAPSAVPRAVLEQIGKAVIQAHQTPELRAKLEAQGFDLGKETGAEFAALTRAETARWARIVQLTGFRAND